MKIFRLYLMYRGFGYSRVQAIKTAWGRTRHA